MSHNRERKEQNCLNCNTEVYGRFCHVCGQENIETKESFWSLTKHFVYDVLHFDGQFFYTLKYLFARPGFVARQYAEGKRVSYLHPIRMYLFTSAVFFLFFFSVNKVHIGEDVPTTLTNNERLELADAWQRKLSKNPGDSILRQRIAFLKDTTKKLNKDSINPRREGVNITFGNKSYHSLHDYDSTQNSLAGSEKDGWFRKRLNRQIIKVSEKYGTSKEGVSTLLETLLHKLPYLLFLSLPFFALILKLLYIRSKNFYYSDHAVFTLYHYIFTFILLLLFFLLQRIYDKLQWGLLQALASVLFLSGGVYLYIAMKKFYRQKTGKTMIKFLLLNILALFAMSILSALFFLLSIFQL